MLRAGAILKADEQARQEAGSIAATEISATETLAPADETPD
jgi:hypothetical protein